MSPRAMHITGWVLTVLVSLFLIGGSGIPKFINWEGKDKMLEQMGIAAELMPRIGVLEIGLALLFLIPRTAFLAAVLLTGYLGGAVMTHVRVNDPFYFPIALGVIVWVALGLRQPVIFALAAGAFRPAQR